MQKRARVVTSEDQTNGLSLEVHTSKKITVWIKENLAKMNGHHFAYGGRHEIVSTFGGR